MQLTEARIILQPVILEKHQRKQTIVIDVRPINLLHSSVDGRKNSFVHCCWSTRNTNKEPDDEHPLCFQSQFNFGNNFIVAFGGIWWLVNTNIVCVGGYGVCSTIDL